MNKFIAQLKGVVSFILAEFHYSRFQICTKVVEMLLVTVSAATKDLNEIDLPIDSG